jgi:hypothetical protein
VPLVVLVAVMSIGFLGGGVFMLIVQRTGERTTATVTDCVHRRVGKSSVTDYCTGTWVKGGSLLDGGHVVIGTIDGASRSDVGKKIDVRLSGGRAYTTSLRLPVILLVIGLLFAVFGGREIWKQTR